VPSSTLHLPLDLTSFTPSSTNHTSSARSTRPTSKQHNMSCAISTA
jgi:hypothetical protein